MAMKVSVLCVMSAFEWSLISTSKSSSGTESIRCYCEIRYIFKFTAASVLRAIARHLVLCN